MDDLFLKDYGREPRPGFARALRERLRALEEREERRSSVWRPALALAASIVVVGGAFTVPAVRGSAQAFLDMFRVRNFAAVPFDAARLERLKSLEGDKAMLVFDQQVIQEPTRHEVANAAAAEAMAGIPVRSPSHLPGGFTPQGTTVSTEARARLTADPRRLEAVIEALGLRDVRIPEGLDRQPVEVHLWPVVQQRWTNDAGHAINLIQTRSPEVGMAPGVELAQLGEIGLRILGLPADEARRMARTIEWHNTLVVPVPLGASGFREVTVRGHKGLMIELSESKEGRRRHGGSMVMWAEGDQVFALSGRSGSVTMMQIAESVE